jgi:hypothetical protein
MTTDEQLIRRIRTALHHQADELAPVPDMLHRLRARPGPQFSSVSRVRGRIGGGMAALGSAAVVALVVIVIGAVGHGGSGSADRSSLSTARRNVIDQLAVLRRPQRASDRLPAGAVPWLRHFGVAFDPRLTRLVASIDAGPGRVARVQVYLILGARSAPHARNRLAAPATLVFVGISRQGRALFAPGLSGFTGPLAVRFPQANLDGRVVGAEPRLWAELVPDGVARVKWVFSQFPLSRAPLITVYPHVEDNVAITTAGPETGNLASTTWYSSAGQPIASFNHLPQIEREEAAQARLVDRSAHQPIARALLAHFSVFRSTSPSGPIKPLPAFARVALAGSPQDLNVDQARFVRYPGTHGFWLIPGRLGVVIAILGGNPPGLSSDGALVDRVLAARMITTHGSAPPEETVYGLVPDGNRTITINLADGTTKTVRVIDNAYAVTLTQKPATLSAKDASGQMVVVRVPG